MWQVLLDGSAKVMQIQIPKPRFKFTWHGKPAAQTTLHYLRDFICKAHAAARAALDDSGRQCITHAPRRPMLGPQSQLSPACTAVLHIRILGLVPLYKHNMHSDDTHVSNRHCRHCNDASGPVRVHEVGNPQQWHPCTLPGWQAPSPPGHIIIGCTRLKARIAIECRFQECI